MIRTATKTRPATRTAEAEIEIIDLAERRLAKLELENRRLANEVSRLRDKLPPTRHEAIVIQAAQDARTILHLTHARYDVTRRRMQAMGLLSEFHYGWARAMLKAARVLNADVSTLDGLAAAISKVDAKANELLLTDAQGPDKLFRLRQYAGKKFLSGRWKRLG